MKTNQLTEEDIERKIEEWEQSDSPLALYAYLGWTSDEYMEYVANGVIPEPKL